MTDQAPEKARRRRAVPLLWASGAVAAAVLVLGVNGTLSSWTDAVINNGHDTVASAATVGLLETGPDGTTCDTANVANDTTGATTSECDTINKYGGIADSSATNTTDQSGTRLSPDGTSTQSVTVKLTNDGTELGHLTLTPAACSHSAYPGETTADTTDYNLCGQMQVALTCTGGLTTDYTYAPGTTPATLNQFQTDGAQTIGDLAAGAETSCTFTVTLPPTTPAGYASQVASQALKWEIKA